MPPLPRSFRTQLAVSFALLGGLLGLLLAFVLGSMLAQGSQRDAGRTLHGIAGNSARLLGDGLALRLREVQILSDSPTLWNEGLATPRVAQVLYRSQALNPFSAWIGVTDAAGVVRMATGRLLVGQDVSARPWFQAARSGPHVGDVHPAKLLAQLLPAGSDGGPQRFVDFAAPIHRDGQLIGVLCIHGSWEWTRATIESLMPPIEQRQGLEVMVFDRAGRMIYAPDGGLPVHLQAGQTLPSAAAAGGRPGEATVTRWAEGEDYLTAAVPLRHRGDASDLGWTVVARQPVAVAYAPGRRASRLALWLGAAAALVSALLGWCLAARLTRPLRHMARDAHALDPAAGVDAWPLHRGSLEIEQLSAALGSMTRGLVQANAQLEQRVRERTIELERANAALQRLAAHDPLTGLLNRRGLEERVSASLASARRRNAPLSLLLLDIDHFKKVNDGHGHDVGDLVLKAVAECLKRRLREVDVVARIGGEEFVVLLPDTGSFGACQVAGALVRAVQVAPMPVVGGITISCGVAEIDADTETADDALRRADGALYEAKHGGRNQFCLAAPAQAPTKPLPESLPESAAVSVVD